MTFSVGSNFTHTLNDPRGETARRFFVGSLDYSNHVDKWPVIKRQWNNVRAATVSISLENASQLFNFFHTDKTRLKDAVDIDYGVRYRSHNEHFWSHDYSVAHWTKQRLSVMVDTMSNPINQEVDADKIYNDTSVNTTHNFRQILTKRAVFEEGEHWSAFYAKPDESLAIQMLISNGADSAGITFDVQSGGIVGSAHARFLDYFIRQETNGWYHCGGKYATQGSDDVQVQLRLTNPNSKNQTQYTGNGSAGMYVYGMQLQEARYSDSHQYFMTGGTPQQPYGMNLSKYTEVFSGPWSLHASTFRTLNNTYSPDGTATATRLQNSDGGVLGNVNLTTAMTDEEQASEDYWCGSVYVKGGTSSKLRFLNRLYPVSSSGLDKGHDIRWDISVGSLSDNFQRRTTTNSGQSWISAGGAEELTDGWVRLWTTIRNPRYNDLVPTGMYDRFQSILYPTITPDSGDIAAWGHQIEKGGKELMDGPGAYVAVHTGTQIYPSNAEDMIDLFDGTIRDANFTQGKVKIQAKDKFRFLSEQIVGTGEVPVAVDSITPSWLAFTLCSCYGGMDNTQSAANTDIDWAAVDSWDSYNTANTVHVKTDFRGMKVTEALKRIARMTRTAIFMEEDRVTFRRWTNVATQIATLDNRNLLSLGLSVNDEDLVNKQWVFGDWDQSSNFYQMTVFDEDTASQNSFGLHERIIRDKAVFYVTSAGALDTVQRIVANESEPVDVIRASALPGALNMQMGESISIDDPLLNVAGTFRIMRTDIDMNKDRITFGLDNSQLILGNPFILDTSSLGGTDILS